MPNNRKYLSNAIICPYCKGEEKQIIYCRGFMPNTALHIAFAFPADRVEYKEEYCERNYDRCKLAKMLEDVDD